MNLTMAALTDVIKRVVAGGGSLIPTFSAYNSASELNNTGDSTIYTCELDTEVFDSGGNFNTTTDTFTAPITGVYQLSAGIRLTSCTSAHTKTILAILTSNKSYTFAQANPYAGNDAAGNYQAAGSFLADMDAGDTATLTARVDNGAKTVGVSSGLTMMQGHLVA